MWCAPRDRGRRTDVSVTEKYATEPKNMLAQPVRKGAQHNDVRRESKTTTKATESTYATHARASRARHLCSTGINRKRVAGNTME